MKSSIPKPQGFKIIGGLASLVSWHDSNAVLYRRFHATTSPHFTEFTHRRTQEYYMRLNVCSVLVVTTCTVTKADDDDGVDGVELGEEVSRCCNETFCG